MRMFWATAALAAVTACTTTVPDSGAGVGFGDYESYEADRQAREAALRNSQAQIAPATPSTPVISAEELSSAGLPVSSGATAAPPVPPATPAGPTVASASEPGISDEQDFTAVAARETIESDRERLEQNAAAYVVVQPTVVPDRPGDTGPNIAAYALATTNAVGQKIYNRSGFNLQERSVRSCAAYASPDLAQIDFLKNGGPQRDPKSLDPDGDGFACFWDPSPFRLAAR